MWIHGSKRANFNNKIIKTIKFFFLLILKCVEISSILLILSLYYHTLLCKFARQMLLWKVILEKFVALSNVQQISHLNVIHLNCYFSNCVICQSPSFKKWITSIPMPLFVSRLWRKKVNKADNHRTTYYTLKFQLLDSRSTEQSE